MFYIELLFCFLFVYAFYFFGKSFGTKSIEKIRPSETPIPIQIEKQILEPEVLDAEWCEYAKDDEKHLKTINHHKMLL